MDVRSESGQRLRAKGAASAPAGREPDQPRRAVVRRRIAPVTRSRAFRGASGSFIRAVATEWFRKLKHGFDVRITGANARSMASDIDSRDRVAARSHFRILPNV